MVQGHRSVGRDGFGGGAVACNESESGAGSIQIGVDTVGEAGM